MKAFWRKSLLFLSLLLSNCSIGLDWEKYKNTLEGVIIARYFISSSSIADICYSKEENLLVAVDDANLQLFLFSSSLNLQTTIPFLPFRIYTTCTYSSTHKKFYVGGDDSNIAVIDSIHLSSQALQTEISISNLSTITQLVSSSDVLYFLGTKGGNSTIGKTTPSLSLDTTYGNSGISVVDSSSFSPSEFFLGINSSKEAISLLNFSSTNTTKMTYISPTGSIGNTLTLNGSSGGLYMEKEEFWMILNSPSKNQVSIRRYNMNLSILEEFLYFPPSPLEGRGILRNPLVEEYEKYIVGVGDHLLFLPRISSLLIHSYPIKKMVWKEEGKALYLLTKVDGSHFEILLVE